MKLGLDARHKLDDELLTFGRQVGATHVIAGAPIMPSDKGYYHFFDLLRLRKRVEDAGMVLWAIENVPFHFYDKVIYGLPGRDEQIENWCKTLRNMGKAGIPVLGYHFMAVFLFRTSESIVGRGGALVTGFDYDLVKDAPVAETGEITEEQLWDNLTYFLKAVIPVAEQAGVRMALHPDDPPISPIAGVARIMRSHAALKRLTEIVPSPSNALNFCQGTVSEMPENVLDAIRYFGQRKKIFYVHFRNTTGPVPSFAETFIDNGFVDMLQAMRAYAESGFEGYLIDDHTPGVVNDAPWGFRGRAYSIGYMKALIKAVQFYEGRK